MYDDEWLMMNDEWWMMNDEWWMMNDERWMMIDEWCMMNDEWWMMNAESLGDINASDGNRGWNPVPGHEVWEPNAAENI